jgi:hypothetical protein
LVLRQAVPSGAAQKQIVRFARPNILFYDEQVKRIEKTIEVFLAYPGVLVKAAAAGRRAR